MFPMAATLLAIIFGLPVQAYVNRAATPHDVVSTRVVGASTQQLPHGVVVETDATHSKEITLKGGSRVVLRPGTRFTYEYIEPMSLAVMAILEGEASINLSQGDRAMRIKTSAGGALLMPGNYAVRCERSCAAMLLTVSAGRAMIRADTAKMGLTILSGGKGRVWKAGAAERVAGGPGWPVVEPAKP